MIFFFKLQFYGFGVLQINQDEFAKVVNQITYSYVFCIIKLKGRIEKFEHRG